MVPVPGHVCVGAVPRLLRLSSHHRSETGNEDHLQDSFLDRVHDSTSDRSHLGYHGFSVPLYLMLQSLKIEQERETRRILFEEREMKFSHQRRVPLNSS